MTALSSFQQAVLRAAQEPLPLCRRPFAQMAVDLGCDEDTLLDAVNRLKDDGWMRRYRGQVRYRALGRVAVLAAAAVEESAVERVAAQISALAGVSHNYQRKGNLNLWFTLQDDSIASIEAALVKLQQQTGLRFYSFPAETVYKLNVWFDPAGPGPQGFEPQPMECSLPPISRAVLTDAEVAALKAVQQELPLTERPFAVLLRDAGGEDALSVVRSLAEKGVLSKIAAVPDYRKLGYAANTMVCAAVDAGDIDAVGTALAQIPAVSHCYRRPAYPDWPYTLYAMLHADSDERIEAFAAAFFSKYKTDNVLFLPTVREWKKSPVVVTPPI